jgi:hypothetical protein
MTTQAYPMPTQHEDVETLHPEALRIACEIDELLRRKKPK